MTYNRQWKLVQKSKDFENILWLLHQTACAVQTVLIADLIHLALPNVLSSKLEMISLHNRCSSLLSIGIYLSDRELIDAIL